jgi:hypothetical protein
MRQMAASRRETAPMLEVILTTQNNGMTASRHDGITASRHHGITA